jgi:hypothetical protein
MIEYVGGIPPVLVIYIYILSHCGSSGGGSSSSSLTIFYMGWVVILEEEAEPARQPTTHGGEDQPHPSTTWCTNDIYEWSFVVLPYGG